VRVLVAEHDENVRRVLVELLRANGHDALVASDGNGAWAGVLGFGVDVVMADRDLPGLDGLELCRRIRKLDEDDYTYFVLLTDGTGRDEALRAVRAGVDDHLVKPLDPIVLEARLVAAERVTELHRQLGERRAELRRLNEALREAARTDALTGLFNRRRLDEDEPVLDEGLRRYGRPFAVGLVDVDNFKAYNDRYGHTAGDEALRAVADRLRRTARQGDLAYRYGGEEFLFVYPAQGIASAVVAAERARVAVESLHLPHEGNPSGIVTISVGVAAAVDGGFLVRAIQDADTALYDAKAGGRNCVRAHLGKQEEVEGRVTVLP
jgi:two-component system chemotaxis response regulator CheY